MLAPQESEKELSKLGGFASSKPWRRAVSYPASTIVKAVAESSQVSNFFDH